MKTERLSCKLTDTELKERGMRLADLRKQIAEVEAAKKQAAENFKSQIITLVKNADDVTEEINTKSELRDVEVTEEKDFAKKQAYIIRLDTNETIRTRALSPQELQRPLLFDKGKTAEGILEAIDRKNKRRGNLEQSA